MLLPVTTFFKQVNLEERRSFHLSAFWMVVSKQLIAPHKYRPVNKKMNSTRYKLVGSAN